MPTELITTLPRLKVVADDVPGLSGSSHWDGSNWLIVLNRHERQPRQRFALAHELKHVIDHTTRSFLYNAMPSMNPVEQAEQAADYFAGCLLVPKRWLQQACHDGARNNQEIARLFCVPVGVAEIRLNQCGLAPGRKRRTIRKAFQARLNRISNLRPGGRT